MRRFLEFTALAAFAWWMLAILFAWMDYHCDGAHAGECVAEYALLQPCSLGLDDAPVAQAAQAARGK